MTACRTGSWPRTWRGPPTSTAFIARRRDARSSRGLPRALRGQLRLDETALRQRTERPGIFAHQLVANRQAKRSRQHFPRVGFHLEMRTCAAVNFQPVEGIDEMVPRVAERH